jgi:hypothetical protein
VNAAQAHSDADVENVLRLIAALEKTLRDERAAIAKLDAAAIDVVGQEKLRLTGELGPALAQLESGSARFVSLHREELREEVRRLAGRLCATAEANRALLDDAIDMIARARGLKTPETGAYDSRARVTQRLRTSGGTRI